MTNKIAFNKEASENLAYMPEIIVSGEMNYISNDDMAALNQELNPKGIIAYTSSAGTDSYSNNIHLTFIHKLIDNESAADSAYDLLTSVAKKIGLVDKDALEGSTESIGINNNKLILDPS